MACSLPHRLLLVLFALAMLGKAMVPLGYMPDADALSRGLMRIRICTSMGAQNIWVDKNQKVVNTTSHKDKPRYVGDCVFATGLHFSPGTIHHDLMQLEFATLTLAFQAPALTLSASFNPAAPVRAPPLLS